MDQKTRHILLAAAAVLSLIAAAIHFWVMPEHFEEWWGYGIFFLIAAAAQALFAIAILRAPSLTLLRVGIVGNLAIIVLWVVTRTIGIPIFGPHAGEIEAVGQIDLASKLVEVLLIIVLGVLVRAIQGVRSRGAAHRKGSDYDHGGGPEDTSGHGHDHQNGHGHHHGSGGDRHGHEHGSGVLGRLRHTFVHSHDVPEKVDAALETHERGIWALKISLIGLGLTALFQVVVVWFSGSTALLADTIRNFGDAATSIPLWIAFALLRRGQTRRFTYGFGRAEDVAGVIIVALIFVSACVAGFESIRKLIDPQPVSSLGWVAAAAIVGFLGNEAVAIFRIRVGKEIGSAALIADGQHSRVDGFTSLAVLIGAIGVWAGVPILDPLIGLAITVAILFIVKDAAKTVFLRLLDGVEPTILAEVEHAPLHVDGVQGVHRVRARWLGHKVHADLHLTVDRQLSVAEAHAIVDRVPHALKGHVPAFGEATIHVCPCDHPEPGPRPTVATV